MKKAFVNQSGTIELLVNSECWTVGQLDTYEFKNFEQMHSKAIQFESVQRPSGKTVLGKNYSLKMAQNDWKAYEIIEYIMNNWDEDYYAVVAEDGGIEITRCGIVIMGCDKYGRIWQDNATPEELEAFEYAINYAAGAVPAK